MASDSATALVVLRCLGTLESPAEIGARGSRPHRHETLAGLFWPEMVDSLALSNLRLTLHRLRQALDRAAPGTSAALLTITRQTVKLRRANAAMM